MQKKKKRSNAICFCISNVTGMKEMMLRACDWDEFSDSDDSSVLVHDRYGLGEESRLTLDFNAFNFCFHSEGRSWNKSVYDAKT